MLPGVVLHQVEAAGPVNVPSTWEPGSSGRSQVWTTRPSRLGPPEWKRRPGSPGHGLSAPQGKAVWSSTTSQPFRLWTQLWTQAVKWVR